MLGFSSFCMILSIKLFTLSGVFILYGCGVDCVQFIFKCWMSMGCGPVL